MRRRELLTSSLIAVLAAGSGCTSGALAGGSFGDDSRATDDGEGFERAADVSNVDDLPESSPVRIDVSVTQERITADRTAVFEVTTTNESDGVVRVQPPVYKNLNEDSDEKVLLLFSPDAPDTPDREYSPNCPDNPNGSDVITSTYEGWPTHRLESGETVDTEAIPVNHLGVDGCFVPGAYRYESNVKITEAPDGMSEDGTLDWGFTIEVTGSS